MNKIFVIISILTFSCGEKVYYTMSSPHSSKAIQDSWALEFKRKDWQLHKDSIFSLEIPAQQNPIRIIQECPNVKIVGVSYKKMLKYSEVIKLRNQDIEYLSYTTDTFKADIIKKFRLKGLQVNCIYSDSLINDNFQFDSFKYFYLNTKKAVYIDYSIFYQNKSINRLVIPFKRFDSTIINQLHNTMNLNYLVILIDECTYSDLLKLVAFISLHRQNGPLRTVFIKHIESTNEQFKKFRELLSLNRITFTTHKLNSTQYHKYSLNF